MSRSMTLRGKTKLLVVDDLSPEDGAMLQALYSRSAESAEVHLEKVKQSGSGKFMASYYVGYGHKSIADCGSTTMFIENVSLLAAKAIQDWPLYSGQETSTRYIDMSKQDIVDPVGTDASARVLRRWMAFYTGSQDKVAETIRARYPKKPDEKEDVYERAVKARTFDILRGFLPAGITTQLSWHTNLRQAGDHLVGLTKHPATEVQSLGKALRELLGAQYPSSGAGLNLPTVSGVGNQEAAEAREKWEQLIAKETTYFTSEKTYDEDGVWMEFDSEELEYMLMTKKEAYEAMVLNRPRGCVLPHQLLAFGQMHFGFDLDFGSFRDIQRHRNGVCPMPLLTTNHGFENWYLQQLGSLEPDAQALIEMQKHDIAALTDNEVERQYYIGLGFRVPCRLWYGLPAAVYVMELRSGKMIHPTLRKRVHQMIEQFKFQLPDFPLHVDMDPDDWDVRRGTQTIQTR